MKKKKVLILYATYGSGHKSVAMSIYNYFLEKKKYDVKVMDIMEYENTIGYLSKKAFEQNFKHKSSFLFSVIYEIFDRKSTTIPYKHIVKSLFKNKKLKKEIIEYDPDLVITSHFFGSTIVAGYNKKGLIDAKIITILTDYVSHELWIKDVKYTDAFIVSSDITKNELIERGINKHKIYPYGIPINMQYDHKYDIEIIKKKYKVFNNKKTILMFAGGSLGSSFSYTYFKCLLECRYDVNIIFVCGKNEELRSKCERLVKNHEYKNVNILGFSREVDKLLSISDIVITKPGGLNVTECLEMKKPMLLIQGNGGQEIYNARFVCRNGYGINCKRVKKLTKTVGRLLMHENILNNMYKRLDKYKKNNSIEKVYELSDKMLR